MTYEEMRDEFLKTRRIFARKINSVTIDEKPDLFFELWTELNVKAIDGDLVAQDFISYLFKKGFQDLLDENIDMAMRWQILAGANGNAFSVKRLSLFLGYAYDVILAADDFETIKIRNELTPQNFEFKLGKLICEGIVDDLDINVLSLSKSKLRKLEFNEVTMRVFDRARNNAIPKILDYLRK